MANHILIRNDTAANWAADNPVLADGEMGVQDGATPLIKVGDGVRTWNQLPYSGAPAQSGANVPVPQAGDAGKVVTVNAGATGYELDQGGTSGQNFTDGTTTINAPALVEIVGTTLSGNSSEAVFTISKTLLATLGVQVPGNENGAVAEVMLTGLAPMGTNKPMGTSSDGVPHTLGAGAVLGQFVRPPIFSAGTLTIAYAEFGVSNSTGTEKLFVATGAPVSLVSDTPHHLTAAELSSINEQVGTDLALQTDGTIKSTAGGQFFAYLLASFTVTGLIP